MTLAELKQIRDDALSAYRKALQARQYNIDSGGARRSLQRQDLDRLRAEWEFWSAKVDEKEGRTRRVRYVVPRF